MGVVDRSHAAQLPCDRCQLLSLRSLVHGGPPARFPQRATDLREIALLRQADGLLHEVCAGTLAVLYLFRCYIDCIRDSASPPNLALLHQADAALHQVVARNVRRI